MNEVADKMRLMLAAPHLIVALRALLPMAWKEYTELSAVAMFSSNSEALKKASKWLECILMAECALKEAGIDLRAEIEAEAAKPKLQLVRRAQ